MNPDNHPIERGILNRNFSEIEIISALKYLKKIENLQGLTLYDQTFYEEIEESTAQIKSELKGNQNTWANEDYNAVIPENEVKSASDKVRMSHALVLMASTHDS